MEATIPNFIIPARKVHDSLRFGLFLEPIMRSVQKRETETANTGLIEVIVSISCKPSEEILGLRTGHKEY